MDPGDSPTSYQVREVRIDPGVVLAPMEGVTERCFRRTIRRIGGVGLTHTEFVASKGLVPGRSRRLWETAAFDPDERPIAIQIFGRDPEQMADAATLLEGHGATIIDINMGCPSDKVCSRSGGSALMADPVLAVRIVRAVRAATTRPVTVKMRSGFHADQRNAPELAWRFQEEGADGVTIHWRTRDDRYGGERAVDKIAEAVQRVRIPVVANGDIVDVPSAHRMLRETGCAGLMVGRGAIGNPWLLHQISESLAKRPAPIIDAAERRRVLLGYVDDVIREFRTPRNALGRIKMVTRRFTHGQPGGPAARRAVVRSQTPADARALLVGWLDALAEATPSACGAPGRASAAMSAAPSAG